MRVLGLAALTLLLSAAGQSIDLSGTSPGRSSIFELPDATCSDGSSYVYGVTKGENAVVNSNGLYEKIMVVFFGGGACFDFETCSGRSTQTGFVASFADITVELTGMTLDRLTVLSGFGAIGARLDNCAMSGLGMLPCETQELSDYVALSIPYCTGDVHFGSQTTVYESDGTGESVRIHHHGANHTQRLISMWVDAIGGGVRSLVIGGGSAGGWGAMLWGGAIMERFEAVSSSPGTLKTNVLVDSAFHMPVQTDIAVRVFSQLQWGPSIAMWNEGSSTFQIQGYNLAAMLKEQLRHFGGRYKIAFIQANNDLNAVRFSQYMVAKFAPEEAGYDRAESMWSFLGEMHSYDAELGGEESVFSFVPVGDWHVLMIPKRVPGGNENAPDLAAWVYTFLTTGYPYKVASSAQSVWVGGPSYRQYQTSDEAAVDDLRGDAHADKYWCCVRDLLDPGGSFSDAAYEGAHEEPAPGYTFAPTPPRTLAPTSAPTPWQVPCEGAGAPRDATDCGRGTRGECPAGHWCDIHPTDRWALCCPFPLEPGAREPVSCGKVLRLPADVYRRFVASGVSPVSCRPG